MAAASLATSMSTTDLTKIPLHFENVFHGHTFAPPPFSELVLFADVRIAAFVAHVQGRIFPAAACTYGTKVEQQQTDCLLAGLGMRTYQLHVDLWHL